MASPHRAGAGDDEHGDRIDDGEGERRVGPEDEPDFERRRRHGHDRRHEPHRHPVHQGLDRQLRSLRLLDHADDLREHRRITNRGRPDAHRTLLIHRAADDGAPRRLGNRDRLAGDHRFIDVALALNDFAVDRHALARSDLDHVASHHLADVDDAIGAADMGDPRLQADQSLDRLGRPPLGASFEEAAEQDQGDDHCRRFVIDVDRAGRQKLRRKGRDQRIEIRGKRADGHERVHIGGQPRQRWQTLRVESPSRHDQNQRRQRELDGPVRLHADGSHDQVMDRGHEMRAHPAR